MSGLLATGDYLIRARPWLCAVCFLALVGSVAAQVAGIL